jgi:SAM-dependent methyltransferase
MSINCTVCGSTSQSTKVNYGPVPLCDDFQDTEKEAKNASAFAISVVTCPNCNHSELLEKPPEDIIYANYKYFSSNSPDLDSHFTNYASWIVNTLGVPPGSMHIDVGCNDGLLLSKSRDLGLNTAGIDPSPAALDAAKKGLDIVQGYLSKDIVDQNGLANRADVITCNNVIANIRDLLDFGHCISSMLKEGGYFVIETLHYPTLLQKNVYEMVNHEHYHYFSVDSVVVFLKSIGLRLISCDHVPTKGANARWVAQKLSGGDAPKPIIDPILADAEAGASPESFMNDLESARKSIKSLINEVNGKGPVAGFGSSAGTTILKYILGLQDKTEFLVDDNPSRHGLYAPGSGIPIISPAEYYSREPALTVIFAWRFGQIIATKHTSKVGAEHKFVQANTGQLVSSSQTS